MRRLSRRWIYLPTATALVVGAAVVAVNLSAPDADDAVVASDASCARGFEPVSAALAEVRKEMRAEKRSADEAERAREEAEREGPEGEHLGEFAREAMRELPMLQGTDPDTWDTLCVTSRRPESLKELNALFNTRAAARLAPYGAYRQGAALNAAREARALTPGSVPETAGKATRWGRGPLIVNSPDYPEVNGLGLKKNSGRIDSYAYDWAHKRIWAAAGNGGIWRSDDKAASWTNANGNLPTTVTGAVGWTQYNGGTLLALTGEPTFGADAYTGYGAYWSADLGKHWKRATGVPSGALGFEIAVDPNYPNRVYAATQRGLFRSNDGGRSYKNVLLPTGPCAGKTNMAKNATCALANVVTDVVIARKGGVNTETKPGTVVAVVGWRGGQRENPDGSVQSPNNGVYRSGSGKVGSFKKLAATGFASQDAIGRVELGNAIGKKQDHDFLYAVVQDANLLNDGGVTGIDVPGGESSPLGTTVLNGLYVSSDFGRTWTQLTSGTELAADPTTGSALVGTGTATGYQPGVQGWYNQWIQPDPTRADGNGVPTRLAFGLEEIWANDAPEAGQPLDGQTPVKFRVVGKYFGGDSCLLLSAGLPACPGDREPGDDNSTTHPDQQEGMWFPDATAPGGVQLIVGNDGGSYRYRFEEDDDAELDNSHWGPGDQTGYYTLMPYYAAVSNDGTVYGGLQDNGNLKIDGKSRKQYETYGGDGFFSAVDPYDSDITYEEYTNAAIAVSTDGGTSWNGIDPGLTASKFSNPFLMDPTNAKHLITAGREVVETLVGPSTTSGMTDAADADASTTTWIKVFDLGTRAHPGDAGATGSASDPDNSMSAVATRGNASYVGFCGYCDTLNKAFGSTAVFQNGLATNVAGDKPAKAGSADGWHFAAANGLPNRYITSIAIDPKNKKRVFVTVGGYTRRWLPFGAVGDTNAELGTGHVYRSDDAGQNFVDVSGNLPDAPASWVAVRGRQLLVATDVGAFASGKRGALVTNPKFARFAGIPRGPVSSIVLKPNNPNVAVLAVFGRSVWGYTFEDKLPLPDDSGVPTTPTLGTAIQSWDFEADDQGWTADGVPPTWTRQSPGHGAGTEESAGGQAFSITGPAGYIDNMDVTLTSPQVSVPAGDAVVQWYMKLDSESYDPVTVEWSSDGSTWQPLGTYAGTSGDLPGWSKYSVFLPAPGGNVQLRFHFVSDAFCSAVGGPLCSSIAGYDGVFVDDVTIGTPAG